MSCWKDRRGQICCCTISECVFGFTWVRTRPLLSDLPLNSLKSSRISRSLDERIDSDAITEEQSQKNDETILEKHKQVPFRNTLTDLVAHLEGPVVVDSIHYALDLNRDALGERPALIWFVDCSDAMIRERLTKKVKPDQRRSMAGSPVDPTASQSRNLADYFIPNSGSLEDLRWCVDDTLFRVVEFQTS